jgi:anti-sigma factor ChrR (cupin superfamily)
VISQQQQEQASLYALGALTASEKHGFETEMLVNPELADFTHSLQSSLALVARAIPDVGLPFDLKDKVLQRIAGLKTASAAQNRSLALPPGLSFIPAAAQTGWKQLPIPGASVKLLSVERERGYAVLLGKLEPGALYPAHDHTSPENFYILSGDLVVGNRKIGAGDFHHADEGSHHEDSHSVEGCTLIAVLSITDPLVAYAAPSVSGPAI